MGIDEKIEENPVGVPELTVLKMLDRGISPLQCKGSIMDDPDMDEDKLGAIDAGYFEVHTPPTPVANEPHLVRVRIIENSGPHHR